jgi:hypothetical protein
MLYAYFEMKRIFLYSYIGEFIKFGGSHSSVVD